MTMSPNEVVAKVPTQLLIGGEWRKASSGETFTVENPATGETIATLDSANSADAVAALDAACAVQDEWARTTCLLYTSPSPRDQRGSRMPSSA